MPVKNKSEAQQRVRSFNATVARQMALHMISKEQLSHVMQMSRTTLWAKLNDPSTFRLYELRYLFDV